MGKPMGVKLKIKAVRAVLEYLVAFVLLLDCRSVWLYLVDSQEWMPGLLAVCLAGTIGTLCLCRQGGVERRQAQNWLLMVGIGTLYMGGYFLLKPDTPWSILKLYTAFVLAASYSVWGRDQGEPPFLILLRYKELVWIQAAFSLTMWMLGPVAGWIPATSVVYDIWGGGQRALESYFSLFYAEVSGYSFLGLAVPRNIGFFTEAPMHSLHLSIALAAELFLIPKPDKRKCAVLIAAILTTVSVTGYLLVLLALGSRFLLGKMAGRRQEALKLLMLPAGAAAAAVLTGGLVLAKLETSSGFTRLDDFQVGFRAWSQNWLLGNGYGNTETLVQYMSPFRLYNTGFSNSPMLVLAQCGLYLGGVYLLGFARGCWAAIRQKDPRQTVFMVLVGYLFVLTSFPYTYLAVFLICLANLENVQRREPL